MIRISPFDLRPSKHSENIFSNLLDARESTLVSNARAVLLNQFGDNCRPSGLMAGTDTRAIVAMEIFIEQNKVAPVRIGLKFFRAAVHRPASLESRVNIRIKRWEISPATCHKLASLPDPVGHSTL